MSEIDLTNKFTISMGATLVSEEVLGRAEAVSRAKKISLDNRQKVTLQRADEMVTMVFSEGQLETYVCETRERKPGVRGKKSDDLGEDFEGEDEFVNDDEVQL